MTCHPADRDLLIFKALCAVSECANACHAAPIEPTLAIRFAVAFLYANSNGERWVFDEYLETIARQPIVGHVQQEYRRCTGARSCVTGMMDRQRRWECPGIPHQMIARVEAGEAANAVWRAAIEAKAAQDEIWAESERRTAAAKAP